MTVTLGKADILAALFLVVPGIVAVRLWMYLVVMWVMSGTVKAREIVAAVLAMIPLALWCWGMYALAHWFA